MGRTEVDDAALTMKKGCWPVHPDVSVQLDLHSPTLEAQQEFLAALNAQAQKAAWSLCAQVGADAAGVTSDVGDTVGQPGSSLTTGLCDIRKTACDRLQHRCDGVKNICVCA